jgi:L-fuconolactonase
MDAAITPVVDSHVHFWDPERISYPWLTEVPAIAQAHTPDQLAAEAGSETPPELVFVQAGCADDRFLDEVKWVERLSGENPRIRGIVAFAPMDRGRETVAAIELLRQRPLVRGIRQLIQAEPDPEFCARPAFVEGIQRLAELGLSFDLCVRQWQLEPVTALVRRCSGTQFILDHAGKPLVRSEPPEPWRRSIRELSSLPNVCVKLSGLVTEAGSGWTVELLRPYAEHVFECFGAERVLFGSDWPVVKLAGDYRSWLSTARALCRGLSSAETAAVFSGNARRVYRLGKTS